jgi:hypothetical protein
MKTAVEWLEEQVIKFHNWKLNPLFDENCFDEIELRKAIQKAKEMEKNQIVDAYNEGVISVDCRGGNPEKYYNQTFKQQEQ